MAMFRDQNRGVRGCAPVPYPADTLAQLKSFIKENLPTYDSDEREVTPADGNQHEIESACAAANICTAGPEVTSSQAYSVEPPPTERRVFVTTGVITLRDFTVGDNAGSPSDSSSEAEATCSNAVAPPPVVCNRPSSVEDIPDASSSARQEHSIPAEEGSKRCCTQAKLVLSPPLMSLAAKVNETFVARRHVSISLSDSGSDGETGNQCAHDTTAHNVAQAIQRLEKAYTRDKMRRRAMSSDNGKDPANNNTGHDTGPAHFYDQEGHRHQVAGNVATATPHTNNVAAESGGCAMSRQVGDDSGNTRHRDNTAENAAAHHTGGDNGHHKYYSEIVHHNNNGQQHGTEQSKHRDCARNHGNRHDNIDTAIHQNHTRGSAPCHPRVDNLSGSNGHHADNRGAARSHAKSRENLSTDDESAPYCRPRYTGRRRRQYSNAGDSSPARQTVREAAASLERGDFGVRAREQDERERVDGARRVRRCPSWHDDNDDGYASPDTISSDTSDASSVSAHVDATPRTRCRVLVSNFKNGRPGSARSSPETAPRHVQREQAPPPTRSRGDVGAAMSRLPAHPTPERQVSPTVTFHDDTARLDEYARLRRSQQPSPRQFGRGTDTAATPGSRSVKRSASMKTHFGYVDRGRVPSFRRMNAILRRHSCRETPANKTDGNSLESRIKSLLRQPPEEETSPKRHTYQDNNSVQPANEGPLYSLPPVQLFSGNTENNSMPVVNDAHLHNRPPLQIWSGHTENECVSADSSPRHYDNRSFNLSTSHRSRNVAQSLESRGNRMRYPRDATWTTNNVVAMPSEMTRTTNSPVAEVQRPPATNEPTNIRPWIPRRQVSASAPPTDHVVIIPAAQLELLPTDGTIYHNTESGASRLCPECPPSCDSPQGERRSNNMKRNDREAIPSPTYDVRGDKKDELVRPRADTTDSSVSRTLPKYDRVAQLKADKSDPGNTRPPASPSPKRGKATGSRAGKRALERVSSVHLKVNNWLNRQDHIVIDGHVSDTDSDRTWPFAGHRAAEDNDDTAYISPANTRKVLHKVLQMRRNSFRRDTGSAESGSRRAPAEDVASADRGGAFRSRALLATPLLIERSVDAGCSPTVQCDRSSPSDVATDGTESSRNHSLSLLDGITSASDNVSVPPIVHQRAVQHVSHVSQSAGNSRTGTPVSQPECHLPSGTQSPSLGSDRSRTRRASQPADVRWRPLVTSGTPPLRLASDIGNWLETNRTGRLPSRTHSVKLPKADVPRRAMGSGGSDSGAVGFSAPVSDFSGRLSDTQHALFSSC